MSCSSWACIFVVLQLPTCNRTVQHSLRAALALRHVLTPKWHHSSFVLRDYTRGNKFIVSTQNQKTQHSALPPHSVIPGTTRDPHLHTTDIRRKRITPHTPLSSPQTVIIPTKPHWIPDQVRDDEGE